MKHGIPLHIFLPSVGGEGDRAYKALLNAFYHVVPHFSGFFETNSMEYMNFAYRFSHKVFLCGMSHFTNFGVKSSWIFS